MCKTFETKSLFAHCTLTSNSFGFDNNNNNKVQQKVTNAAGFEQLNFLVVEDIVIYANSKWKTTTTRSPVVQTSLNFIDRDETQFLQMKSKIQAPTV